MVLWLPCRLLLTTIIFEFVACSYLRAWSSGSPTWGNESPWRVEIILQKCVLVAMHVQTGYTLCSHLLLIFLLFGFLFVLLLLLTMCTVPYTLGLANDSALWCGWSNNTTTYWYQVGSSTLCWHCFEHNRVPLALRNYGSIIAMHTEVMWDMTCWTAHSQTFSCVVLRHHSCFSTATGNLLYSCTEGPVN